MGGVQISQMGVVHNIQAFNKNEGNFFQQTYKHLPNLCKSIHKDFIKPPLSTRTSNTQNPGSFLFPSLFLSVVFEARRGLTE